MPENDSNDDGFDAGEIDSQVEQAMELFLKQLELGKRPDREAFLAQFPKFSAELDRQLEALEFLHLAAPEVVEISEESQNSELGNRTTLGDFRLERQLGQGGMGVVYEAMQLSLDRRVAVKVLPFAAMLDVRQRKRFQNEARAAATLDHPNIVPIYFVGQERGVHFYAMQLIGGQSLAEVVQGLKLFAEPGGEDDSKIETVGASSESGAQPQAENQNRLNEENDNVNLSTQRSESRREFYASITELGIQAARALQHAHQHGVVHRDIKPGNLLLDETGKLWVTDFGLAHVDAHDSMTGHGDVLGTIGYMSPEQVSGTKLVDARSDVYSLAATMYELLTLNRPFAETKLEAQSRRNPPAPLRSHDRQIPADLETIVLKAMSDDPVDRYASAEDFAADMQRFVSGQSITARRPTLGDRMSKWFRRHPKLVVTGMATVALVFAALATSFMLVWNAQDKAKLALAESLQRTDELEDLQYITNMREAFRIWDSGRVSRVQEVLKLQIPKTGQKDRRGFEWRLLNALTKQSPDRVIGRHPGGVQELAVFPHGRKIASVGDDKTLRIWELDSEKELLKVEIKDPNAEQIAAVAISPDGRTIATGGHELNLWDAETGKHQGMLTEFQYHIEAIAFSPDGEKIAAGSRYDQVRLLTIDGTLIREIEDGARHDTLSFTPDGKRLLVPQRTEEGRGFLSIWDSGLQRVERAFIHRDAANEVFVQELPFVIDDTKIVEGQSGLTTGSIGRDDFIASVDRLGDVDGDGIADVIIGVPYDETEGRETGAAFVLFMNRDGTVRENVKLSDGLAGFHPDGLDENERFGHSVAGIGDLDGDGVVDAVIGTPFDELREGEHGAQGAIYVLFLNSDGTARHSVKITDGLSGLDAPSLTKLDLFGSSVAGIGDLNGDGIIDIAVGAIGDEAQDQEDYEGALYILLMNRDGTVRKHVKIGDNLGGFRPSSMNRACRFGSDVSAIEDLDHDGITELVVGASHDDDQLGCLYILYLNADGTVKKHTHIAPGKNGFFLANGAVHGYRFGTSVCAVSDLDGNGACDLLVGVPRNGDLEPREGACYLLLLNADGTVNDHVKICDGSRGFAPEGLGSNDEFGASCAYLGGTSRDGGAKIAIVARNDEGLTENEGAVYVLRLTPDWDLNKRSGQRTYTTVGDLTHSTVSSDGRYIVASATYGTNTAMFDIETGEQLLQLPEPFGQTKAIALSNDGTMLAAAYDDGVVHYWRLDRTTNGEWLVPPHHRAIRAHDGQITSIKFIGNDQLITSGADTTIKTWTIDQTYPIRSVTLFSSFLAGSNDGSCVAAGYALPEEARLQLLNQDGQPGVVITGPGPGVAVSGNGVAVALANNHSIQINDTSTGAVVQTLTSFEKSFRAETIALNPDATELAVVRNDRELGFWDVKYGHQTAFTTLHGDFGGAALKCKYSPDGNWLAVAGRFRSIAAVDVKSRRVVQRIRAPIQINELTFNRNGTMLASGHTDGSIRLWEWPSGKHLGRLIGPSESFSFSKDGRTIVSLGGNGTIRFWSVEHRREFGVFRRSFHGGVMISANGKKLYLAHNGLLTYRAPSLVED